MQKETQKEKEDIHVRPNKKTCVSGYRQPLSLGHRPWFFIVVFGFLQLILFAEKCFQFQVYFVATYIKTNFTKSVSSAADNTSVEIKLLASEKEGGTSRDIMWQTEKWRYASSVFIKKVFQANRYISKNTKIFLPTYPNFKKHVTGNTYFLLCLKQKANARDCYRSVFGKSQISQVTLVKMSADWCKHIHMQQLCVTNQHKRQLLPVGIHDIKDSFKLRIRLALLHDR